MKMTKVVRTTAVLGLAMSLLITGTGCSVGTATLGKRIDPGEVGLLVDNYGDQKGIDNAQLFTGGKVTFNDITHDLYQYPIYFRTYSFKKDGDEDQSIAFSMGGSSVSMDIGATYKFRTEAVDPAKADYTYIHQFFRNFRVDPDTFNNGTFRNAMRDCASEVGSGDNPVALATNVASFQGPMLKCMQGKFPELEIKEISLLGPLRLPENLQKSIDTALEAKQQAETARANQIKAEAEAKAKVAEANGNAQVTIVQAEAEARANQLKAASVNENLIKYEQVMNDRLRAEKGLVAPINIQSGSTQVAPNNLMTTQPSAQ